MMRIAKILAISFIVLAVCAGQLQADIVEIGITAEVIGIDDFGDLLEGKINVGDIITGSYIYDSDTPDLCPSTSGGCYRHYDSPYGIYLSAGEFVFRTDPNNVYFRIGIGDCTYGSDSYFIISYNNLTLSNGVEVGSIYWQLNDYSCNALSSDALPTTPPVLEDWGDVSQLSITCGYKGTIRIAAEVISVELVEPIEASVEISPNTLNVQSKGRWISCLIRLPEPYDIADIEPNSVLLEGEIEPDWLRLDEVDDVAVVKFSRQELQDILEQSGVTGLVQLKVTGELTDDTAFEGTDVIRVTNKGGKK